MKCNFDLHFLEVLQQVYMLDMKKNGGVWRWIMFYPIIAAGKKASALLNEYGAVIAKNLLKQVTRLLRILSMYSILWASHSLFSQLN